MGRRAPVVLAVALLASPASAREPAVQPFAFADVDFTPDCRPNAALERLLTALHGRAPTDDENVDQPLYDALAGDTFHRLVLDEPAAWHGLHLTGVEQVLGIERGPANTTLVFADSPASVRDLWNARGWRLPPAGQARSIDGLEGYASIEIESRAGGGASVTCFRD